MSLLGLPDTFRFAVWNNTTVAISNVPTGIPKASGRRVRLDTDGALSYEAAEFTFFSVTSALGVNSYLVGSTLTNTSLQYLAIDGLFSSFASGAASGNLYLYLETSPDGGTTWPSPASTTAAGGGFIVAVLGFGTVTGNSTASTVQRINFTFP